MIRPSIEMKNATAITTDPESIFSTGDKGTKCFSAGGTCKVR